MNERGGSCFPTQETLAKETGLGRSTVNRALKVLEVNGWLTRDSGGGRKKGGNGFATTYTATVPLRDSSLPDTVPLEDTNSPAPGHQDVIEDVKGLNREPNGSLVSEVPRLKLVSGQNLALNALAQECDMSVDGGNKGKLAVALNGKRSEQIPGIRAQYWRELALWAEGDSVKQGLIEQSRGEKFERWLAAKVSERATLYRAKFPEGAMLTPLALRTHWTDLPAMRERKKSHGSILDTPNTFPGWGDE